ncbi:hypothetical protein GF312_14915 [Candidatus Poribacteria bacterium]|nr:hypothetical protein [Candidatus Poribacteria bacterium]
MKRFIRFITIEQWGKIEQEYSGDYEKPDLKGILCLLFSVLMLTVMRYYGRPRIFRLHFSKFVNNWLLPTIWPHLYWVTFALFLYLVLPYLFIRFIFGEKIRQHGFSLAGISRYKWIYLGLTLVVIPLVIGASFFPSFIEKYPLYSGARDTAAGFAVWEISYALYFIALEFFFRGFMLFTMVRYIGVYAIFVMVIPYVMIHFGKPFAETLGSIIAGMALGTLSLRTRSIFGGVIIHVLIAWTMDLLAVLMG